MSLTAVDPEVQSWKNARTMECITEPFRPTQFIVSDDLYAKLLGDARENTDVLGYGLAIYRNVLVYNRVPVLVAGPTGEDES